MLKEEKISLTNIGKQEYFHEALKRLTLGQDLDSEQKIYILSCAILFLKEYEKDTKMVSYADLGYYIILKYSINTGDYKPLYDFSVNFGFYPISKVILKNNLLTDFFLTDFLIDPAIGKFKHEDGYIETYNQYRTRENFIKDFSFEKSFVAPTSFGKSSVIIEYLRSLKNFNDLKVAIIVPTKSLLMQTYKMIRSANLVSKIIIHDDMYAGESSFIGIFTQERALRLLNKDIFFDVIVVDEAHKIFDRKRGILISRLIRKNSLLNGQQKVIYLSPLVESTDNLKVSSEQVISEHHIQFNLKEPEFFEFKKNSGSIYKYNRFVNQFYKISSINGIDSHHYIKLNSGNKNFIFENSPKKIEEFARDFCDSRMVEKIDFNDEILSLKEILSEKIHEDYYAIKYLDYGLVYIHGQLPDLIKEYLEFKFKSVKSIKYLVANTVILEGINLPIDTLFICGAQSISNGKSLLNLVGRVNRLDQIFQDYKEENLRKLLPRIHIINDRDLIEDKHDSKFKYLRSRFFVDILRNPTLPSYDIKKDAATKEKKDREKFITRMQKLQKYEEFIYDQSNSDRDKIKKYFIENSLNNYYLDTEKAIDFFLQKKKEILSKDLSLWKELPMMSKIANIFIQDKENISNLEFKRLSNEHTQKYYEGYFSVASKQSLKANIAWQVKKFNQIILNPEIEKKKKAIYIGESYADTYWNSDNPDRSKFKVYVSLFDKNQKDLVNIAIVKLQIEENFVGFTLNKFITALYDNSLISEDEYNTYIYGTTDFEKINLYRQGLNLNLITKLTEANQLINISTDDYNNLVGNDTFKSYLETVDDFSRFEIERYIN